MIKCEHQPECAPAVQFHPVGDNHDTSHLDEVWCVTLGLDDETAEARHAAYLSFAESAMLLLERPATVGEDGRRVECYRGNPVAYLARHAAELALKIVVPKPQRFPGENGHRLSLRLEAVEKRMRAGSRSPSPDLRAVICAFDVADPKGVAFRYAADGDVTKTCCFDPRQLEQAMARLDAIVEDVLLPLAQAEEDA